MGQELIELTIVPGLDQSGGAGGRDNLNQAPLERLVLQYRTNLLPSYAHSAHLKRIAHWQFNAVFIDRNCKLATARNDENPNKKPYKSPNSEHARTETEIATNGYPDANPEKAEHTSANNHPNRRRYSWFQGHTPVHQHVEW
jgi:hypothetical protein